MVVKQDRLFQWLDLLLPVLDHIGREKGLASECQGTLLDVMTSGDGDGTKPADPEAAVHLTEIWLKECDSLRSDFDVARTPKEKFLRDTLILYGKRCPQVIDLTQGTTLPTGQLTPLPRTSWSFLIGSSSGRNTAPIFSCYYPNSSRASRLICT